MTPLYGEMVPTRGFFEQRGSSRAISRRVPAATLTRAAPVDVTCPKCNAYRRVELMSRPVAACGASACIPPCGFWFATVNKVPGSLHGTGLELATLFPMPRYFFHTYHDRPHVDHQGEELPDKHAAWREATVMAGQTLQGLDGNLQPGREWRMEVTDEFANRLFVLHIHAERPK